MNLLIKSATIVDSKSDFNNETVDILIENGRISKIAKTIANTKNIKELQLENLHVSQGWFDSSVSFGEPGFEERETITNGLKTAGLSGFTSVALNANANPVIDSYADIALVKAKAQESVTNLYPIGALTKDGKGEDLAELFDMKNAGAVAFYDYQLAVKNPNFMKIALQYASNFDGLVCAFPQDKHIAGFGVANEHINSTKLGLKGIPALAEELQITRDLHILEYTGGKLHIPTISTAKAVELIKAAKAKKLDVTCSVAIHNLVLTDDMLQDFDTNYKVLPPLRTQTDCDALIEGLKDGTIDMVTTDHNPIDIEHKKIEFEYAMYGTIGLESAFGVLRTLFSTKKTIALLTKGKSRFRVTTHPIKENELANLTLFNPDAEHTFGVKDIFSKSKNSAFLGYQLKGKTYGVIANKKILLK